MQLADGFPLIDLKNGDKVRCINKSSKHFGKIYEIYGAEEGERSIYLDHLRYSLKALLSSFEKFNNFKDIERLFEL